MARRTAGTEASHTEASHAEARQPEAHLRVSQADGVLSFGGEHAEFTDDTVIDVTEEVLALFNAFSLATGHDAGLEASLGWNLFAFG